MTVVKASCPHCGEHCELHAHAVLVTISNIVPAIYEFVCPSCHESVRKDASDAVLNLLALAPGVRYRRVEAPDEILEIMHNTRPPLTYDDLLDFGLALKDDNWSLTLHPGSSETTESNREYES